MRCPHCYRVHRLVLIHQFSMLVSPYPHHICETFPSNDNFYALFGIWLSVDLYLCMFVVSPAWYDGHNARVCVDSALHMCPLWSRCVGDSHRRTLRAVTLYTQRDGHSVEICACVLMCWRPLGVAVWVSLHVIQRASLIAAAHNNSMRNLTTIDALIAYLLSMLRVMIARLIAVGLQRTDIELALGMTGLLCFGHSPGSATAKGGNEWWIEPQWQRIHADNAESSFFGSL